MPSSRRRERKMKRTTKPPLEPATPASPESDSEILTGDVLSERDLQLHRPPASTLPIVATPTVAWEPAPSSEASGARPSLGLLVEASEKRDRSSVVREPRDQNPEPVSTLPAPPDDPPIPLGYIVASAVFLAIAVAGFGLYLAIEVL